MTAALQKNKSVPLDANWNKIASTANGYPAWDSAKSLLNLNGDEVVKGFAIEHQGANTGEIDNLDAMTISGNFYEFPTIAEGTLFTVPAQSSVNFVLTSEFPKMLIPDEYIVTTTVTA
jgi:hypothetical protein